MSAKKEINIIQSDVRNLIIAIFLPFILIFIVEHFGKFEYVGMGGMHISEVRVSSLTFTTPFGNKIYDDVSGKGMGYVRQSDGNRVINGTYLGKLPYYIQGVIKDIIYPIILMIILLVIALLKTKFKFKIS